MPRHRGVGHIACGNGGFLSTKDFEFSNCCCVFCAPDDREQDSNQPRLPLSRSLRLSLSLSLSSLSLTTPHAYAFVHCWFLSSFNAPLGDDQSRPAETLVHSFFADLRQGATTHHTHTMYLPPPAAACSFRRLSTPLNTPQECLTPYQVSRS